MRPAHVGHRGRNGCTTSERDRSCGCATTSTSPRADGSPLGRQRGTRSVATATVEFHCVAVVDLDEDAAAGGNQRARRSRLARGGPPTRALHGLRGCHHAREDLRIGSSGRPSRFLGPLLRQGHRPERRSTRSSPTTAGPQRVHRSIPSLIDVLRSHSDPYRPDDIRDRYQASSYLEHPSTSRVLLLEDGQAAVEITFRSAGSIDGTRMSRR